MGTQESSASDDQPEAVDPQASQPTAPEPDAPPAPEGEQTAPEQTAPEQTAPEQTDAEESHAADDDQPKQHLGADEEPVAHFEGPHQPKPQRYSTGRGQVPPAHPLDPILPYIAPPVRRRRRSDWPVLLLALIVSGLVMAGCCIAGFALYSGYGK